MTRKQRWRYYCDFCGKAGGHAGHMAKHERGCTMNPNRVCGFHGDDGMDEPQRPLADLFAALESGGMKGLREAADGCPACILAAIRQSPWLNGLCAPGGTVTGEAARVLAETGEFRFAKEAKDFWEERRSYVGD